ncbi:phosphatidylinositol glycan, class M [Fistulifera solaris]|uniref:GPI mannosyltransferase 1 n=1 Tax=Fistulifera solaris TaxID=1519565 RepID=A0A1Z5JMZ0_FISSO|nr:phosphatidylinositol glycan, class M [Fistulifera solaris]|eukprot:GAX15380.1 phosphatidylinositol glycan, class M [Fistulifera solaris]
MKITRLRFLATEHAVILGLTLRLFLAWFLPWLLDNERFIPGVAYTDIDFYVFTDAAAYIQQGQNPFTRATYRYTPFLAALLAWLPNLHYGRYLFCIADTLCGWLIVQFRKQRRIADKSSSLTDALWWLYNPLAINICTRGSAESLIVLLPVLSTVWIATNYNQSTWAALLGGICHGIAVHAKLYPIIYSLSFMCTFAKVEETSNNHDKRANQSSVRRLSDLLKTWTKRLLQPSPIIFAFSFLATFVGLTMLAVAMYGPIALQEGLLYHFSRVDHRHNYSMHWYWIYLARNDPVLNMAWAGRLLLLPQLVLLVYTSLGIAPLDLSLALFVQTFLFVAHNKVITAQYFTWYLCLLPLCSFDFASRRVVKAVALLLTSVVFWLLSAYLLEMQGWAVHRLVWCASVIFFGANVNLLGALLSTCNVRSNTTKNKIN